MSKLCNIQDSELRLYKLDSEKCEKIEGIINDNVSGIISQDDAIEQIKVILGLKFIVGDICTYKGYTDRFVITYIENNEFFDGLYENGKTINDGKLSLVERVDHCNKLGEFLEMIKEEV